MLTNLCSNSLFFVSFDTLKTNYCFIKLLQQHTIWNQSIKTRPVFACNIFRYDVTAWKYEHWKSCAMQQWNPKLPSLQFSKPSYCKALRQKLHVTFRHTCFSLRRNCLSNPWSVQIWYDMIYVYFMIWYDICLLCRAKHIADQADRKTPFIFQQSWPKAKSHIGNFMTTTYTVFSVFIAYHACNRLGILSIFSFQP